MDSYSLFTFTIGLLGTLATAWACLGLRRWADRAVNTRGLLLIAAILWMPDIWTRWVHQTAEEKTQEILDYVSTLTTQATVPTTTIPK